MVLLYGAVCAGYFFFENFRRHFSHGKYCYLADVLQMSTYLTTELFGSFPSNLLSAVERTAELSYHVGINTRPTRLAKQEFVFPHARSKDQRDAVYLFVFR
jgi:hypothetical protein